MQSIAWWPSVVVLVLASMIDVRYRRVPNWLVVPFLASGIVVQSAVGGTAGAVRSLAGLATAVLLFGLPCLVRAMGMGDLKLAAGVGVWIGPSQMWIAFVVAAIAGGFLAVAYGLWNRSLAESLDRASDLVTSPTAWIAGASRGTQPSRRAAIPYAPAIAVGALFSFFAR